MKSINLEEKNVYGRLCLYPSCEMSRLMCDMAQSKQFTPAMIQTAKVHGYTIRIAGASARTI